MAEQESEFEQNLRRIGRRLRAGLAKQHPVTEERLAPVRQVARQQWERKQQRLKNQPGGKAAKQTPPAPSKDAARSPNRKQPDQDQDHGHSH